MAAAQLFDLAGAHLRALLELADSEACPAAAELVTLLERQKRRKKKAQLNQAVLRESMLMQLVQSGVPEAIAIHQLEAGLHRGGSL